MKTSVIQWVGNGSNNRASVALEEPKQELLVGLAARWRLAMELLRRWGSLLSSPDLAIDLGTANTLIHAQGQGVVLNQPSVLALREKNGRRKLLAVGQEARWMLGRTPDGIRAVRPIRDGVIADFDVTQEMLSSLVYQARNQRRILVKHRMAICVPVGATEIERRALIEAGLAAGARRVALIEEPMAAAIGAGLPVVEPRGSMVVDIGGGTSEIAILSLGGVVSARSLRVAGDAMDEAICAYVRERHNLQLSPISAEAAKHAIGCAREGGTGVFEISGLDVVNGVPKRLTLTANQIADALSAPVEAIATAVKQVLQSTAPQLAADIVETGIVLTGGGALLPQLDRVLHERTGLPVRVAEDPLTCVVRGTARAMEEEGFHHLLIDGNTFL